MTPNVIDRKDEGWELHFSQDQFQTLRYIIPVDQEFYLIDPFDVANTPQKFPTYNQALTAAQFQVDQKYYFWYNNVIT